MSAVEKTELSTTLDNIRTWLERFIIVPDAGDLDTITLWCAHTWALGQTSTTPRLLIDSSMPGSGKTTCIEHLNALCLRPVQAASLGSPAVITRMLAMEPRTILIDEVDRTLDPKRDGVGELIAVINAGYKRGATRPVSVKAEGDWTVKELPTYAPIAMAGNAPLLPDDTRQRCIRVLLMPDIQGIAEDTDWEEIEPDAVALRDALQSTVESAHERIGIKPVLPDGCRGRMAEKWRPLSRIAHAAGGGWVQKVNEAIIRDMAEMELEREDGMTTERPAVVLLKNIHEVWEQGVKFTPTQTIINDLIHSNPNEWGESSNFGKALTVQRMGRMLSQAFKIHSSKLNGIRGYRFSDFEKPFRQFGLSPSVRTGETVSTVLSVHSGDGLDNKDGLDGLDSMDIQTVCIRQNCTRHRAGDQSYCQHHITEALGEAA